MYKITITEQLDSIMKDANQNEFDKIISKNIDNVIWKKGTYSQNQYMMESEPIDNRNRAEYITEQIRKISNLDVSYEQILEF